MAGQLRRAAWIEIDLDKACHNLDVIRRHVGYDRKIIAVVKADAYSHGAIEISRALWDAGVDMLAVTTYNELAALRKGGIEAPILMLGHIEKEDMVAVIEEDGSFTVSNLAQAQRIEAAAKFLGKMARVHIKADTGFSRMGFVPDEAAADAVAAIAAMPHIKIEGLYSHLATADCPDKSFCWQQRAVFEQFLSMCRARGVDFPLLHLANSGAVADLPDFWYDAVRPGMLLYGCLPSQDVQPMEGLEPVLSVKAKIVRMRQLEKGGFVSYGCTWQAPRDSVVATLPLGYADGIFWQLAKGGSVLVRGKRAPIVGRICMDQFVIDVTDIPEAALWDECVLIGRQGEEQITVEEVAQLAGTIHYEVLCHLNARLPKRFLKTKENR